MTEPREALRRAVRAQRRELGAAQRIAGAEALAERLLSFRRAPTHGPVAGYWAVDGEIGLHAWQLRLPAGCTYCLPVLHEDKRLRFAPWRPGAPLATNRYGIPEPDVDPASLLPPDAMTMVVLPLVAFDRQRQRLGMGAGWYDRSFAFRSTKPAPPLLVGAAFSMQEVEPMTPESWDVPLDAVCTERETFEAEAAR